MACEYKVGDKYKCAYTCCAEVVLMNNARARAARTDNNVTVVRVHVLHLPARTQLIRAHVMYPVIGRITESSYRLTDYTFKRNGLSSCYELFIDFTLTNIK